MTSVTPFQSSITMTSRELVDFINSHRKEQAEAAGVEFPSAGFAKLEHADFLKKVPEVVGEVAGNFSGYYTASNGKRNPQYSFPKREACLMAMSYSYDIQAKVFDRMTALEDAMRIQPAATPMLHTPLIEDLAAIDVLARMLNVAPSGKVIMARTVLQQSAPHLLPALPGYTVDAPRDVVVANGSAMPTASATELLKRHNVKMSTAKFNELLENHRLLSRCERITSRGDYKGFWSVTVEGEEYGKNLVSAQNTRETQPHWYVERFGALLKAVGVEAKQ